ncbi:radical SAM protein [Haliangium sp.]|uniref:radical SAM protein n=1 Tax=Haliangium sp. TaxID=2663208 RepID=UPI003D0F6BED
MGVLSLLERSRRDLRETRRDLRFAAGVLRRRPFQVLVQVTNRCNMRCSFCDFWPHGAHPRRELTVADYVRVSDELAALGCFLVSIEGGEPLLRPDIADIVAAFSAHHLPVLYTNGWHVDADKAAALFAAGATQVGVSIDYARADRHDAKRDLAGSFDRAWAAVDRLRAAAPHGGRQVHVMSVIMDDTLDELEPLLQMSAARGVGHCVTLLSTDGFRRGGDGGDQLPARLLSERLLDLWRRFPHLRSFRDYLARMDTFLTRPDAMPTCRAGTQSFNIDHLGNVAPCIEKIDAPVGNLRDAPLAALHERVRRHPEVAGCQRCWTLCRGFTQALGEGGDRRSLADLGTRLRSR